MPFLLQMSWCKLEVIVDDPKNVRPMGPDEEGATEMPTLTVMSIAARTIVNHKDNTREMVCATARVWESGALSSSFQVSSGRGAHFPISCTAFPSQHRRPYTPGKAA